jgi:hypothetical protein
MRAGLIVNKYFGAGFSLQPGIYYSLKGGDQKVYSIPDTVINTIQTKARFHYLEIPLELFFKFKTGPGKIAISVGPEMGIGLKAKEEWKFVTDGVERDSTVHYKFGSKPDQLKRFDFMVLGSLGYEFRFGLFIKGAIKFGLINISNYKEDLVRNHALTFTAGYFITGKNPSN